MADPIHTRTIDITGQRFGRLAAVRKKPGRGGRREGAGKPPHVDPEKREEILREFWHRVECRRWARAMMRDPAVRERCNLLARMGEKLARHAGPLTEDEALAMTPEERERRWAKLSRRDREAFEKTPALRVTLRYRRAKGYRERFIRELAKEYNLTVNLVRHIVKGE